MFVILSKILPLFIYPPGLICILLIVALIYQKRARLRNIALVIALSILMLSGNAWISQTLARSLEWSFLPVSEIPNAEVIIVLGGGTEANQPPRAMVEINGAGDRMFQAARLYKEGKAPFILVSGGSISWLDSRRNSTAASEMAEILTYLGVPKSAIWLQPDSQNTYEDALYSAQQLKEKNIHRVLLVTSAMHMPRSVALFRHQGLEVIPAPVDYSITEASWQDLTTSNFATQLLYLVPTIGNMSTTTSALKEYIGIFIYQLQGWL